MIEDSLYIISILVTKFHFTVIVIGVFLSFNRRNRLNGLSLVVVGLFSLLSVITNKTVYYDYIILMIYILVGILLFDSIIKWEVKRKTKYVLVISVLSVLFLWLACSSRPKRNIYAERFPLTYAFRQGSKIGLEKAISDGGDLNEYAYRRSLMQNVLTSEQICLQDDQSLLCEMIEILLKAGYDVNEQDENGISLLMYASIDPYGRNRGDFDYYDEWDTEFEDYELPTMVTRLLVDYGADVDLVDENGRTALMWACSYKGKVISLNENSPLPPSYLYNFYFFEKTTPSFYYQQIATLIEAGADVTIKDNKGFTAWDYFQQAKELNSQNRETYAQDFYNTEEYQQLCSDIEELLKK